MEDISLPVMQSWRHKEHCSIEALIQTLFYRKLRIFTDSIKMQIHRKLIEHWPDKLNTEEKICKEEIIFKMGDCSIVSCVPRRAVLIDTCTSGHCFLFFFWPPIQQIIWIKVKLIAGKQLKTNTPEIWRKYIIDTRFFPWFPFRQSSRV